MKSSKAAKEYFAKTDYYASCPGTWLGKGAEMLGLHDTDNQMHFWSLADNLDPRTGKTLRPHAKDGDRVGMDFTFNSTKSVGIARELAGIDNAGDPRIEEAHREAVEYAIGLIEADMQTRVKGGREGDRTTGNLVAYRVTHRDTRINPNDQRPDMSLHDHVFVFNTTFDPVEQKWKACQLGQIKHNAPYFEAAYHNRLASNLRDLGYGIRRDGKAFEIAGIDRDLIDKFSRRTAQIKAREEFLEKEYKHPLSVETKAKLGATTRMGKTKELADDLNGYYVSRLTNAEKERLAHLEFEPSYVSDPEKAVRYAIEHEFYTKSVAEERKLYETAIRFGIGSVTPEAVMEEALRQGVLLKDGQATTRAVLAEESRIIDFAREGKGTMRPLVADGRIDTATARGPSQQKGRPDESKRPFGGLGRPHSPGGEATSWLADAVSRDTAILSPKPQAEKQTIQVERHKYTSSDNLLVPEPQSASLYTSGPRKDTNQASLSTEQQAAATDHFRDVTKKVGLSPEQTALVNHVLTSRDQVVLLIGDAGTGKTHAVKSAFDRIHCPVEMLAPSVAASRDVLRKEGFSKADTVASFLLSSQRQQAVKNGVIWVDEAGLLPIRDLSRLTDIAKEQNARLILQGDPKQHRSVVRHGDMLNVLQSHAGLQVGRLTEVWRQKHQGYKRVVEDIAHGGWSEGFDGLKNLGWVQQVEDNRPIVTDYLAHMRAGKDQLLIAPSHAEGDSITAEIRERLRTGGKTVMERGKSKEVPVLEGDDQQLDRLVNLNWSPAERNDMARYSGDEVLVFHRNSGAYRAGQEVAVKDLKEGVRWKSPEHFSVYRQEKLPLAAGDIIRITGRGKADGHTLENGMLYRVKGFDDKKRVVLSNGWVLPKEFKHLAHGYVSTSHSGQGKTVDHVLIAMGSDSRSAISAEQFYVSVSRGRYSTKVYTDMSPEELKTAIHRTDTRKSATELMTPKKKPKSRLRKWMEKAREHFKKLREPVIVATKERERERDHAHER